MMALMTLVRESEGSGRNEECFDEVVLKDAVSCFEDDVKSSRYIVNGVIVHERLI